MTTGADRDRDQSGRPRNARPRDALGRPLPPGSEGVPRISEDLVLSADETLDYAQRLLDDGMAFHAHEVFEAAWKNGPDSERELWQALAQLAVGLTHIQRGNRRGAATLLRRAADRLAHLQKPLPHGISDALTEYAETLATEVEKGASVPQQRLTTSLREA